MTAASAAVSHVSLLVFISVFFASLAFSAVLLVKACYCWSRDEFTFRDTGGLVRFTLEMMDRLAVNRGRFRILELLDVLLRELRAIHLDGAGARTTETTHVIERERP